MLRGSWSENKIFLSVMSSLILPKKKTTTTTTVILYASLQCANKNSQHCSVVSVELKSFCCV